MSDLHITFREQSEDLAVEFVEARIKPEQTKDVTPAYEPITVLPDDGATLGRVNVAAIPDPTAVKEIDTNGDHDVRRYGTARVNVQPNLQTGEATPTEQTQTITPDGQHDGFSSFQVNPIPPQYIIPEGSLNITENADGIDVTEKASVNVNVPIPPGYIKPTGKTTITQNGTGLDISQYAEADIVVPQGVFPTGTLNITQNGQYDVTEKAAVNVSVGSVITPFIIDTIDVADYAGQRSFVVPFTEYDLDEFKVIAVQGIDIRIEVSDWLYFASSASTAVQSSNYLYSKANIFNFTVYTYMRVGQELIYCSPVPNRPIPNEGYDTDIYNMYLLMYSSSNSFVSGTINVIGYK